MSVIACLRIPPTTAVCDLCAELTPVVEPAPDCVWMDWTGGPPAAVLAHRLAGRLARLAGTLGAGAGTRSVEHKTPPAGAGSLPYRLGVAPCRFAAAVLASPGIDKAAAVLPVRPVPGGHWLRPEALPAFAARLPVALLPGLDPDVQAALTALGVNTLGELLASPRDLLHARLGAAAGPLLDWARGHDPRPVRALYPPERLTHRIPAETMAGADSGRLETLLAQAAGVLAARLHAAGQACAELAIVWGGSRHERRFTPPIAGAGQLARAAIWLAKQAVAGWARTAGRGGQPSPLEIQDDCVLEVTPTGYAGRQALLWEPDRPGGARHHPALAAVRARFGHTFRSPARLAGCAREAVARYEAMNRFFRLSDG